MPKQSRFINMGLLHSDHLVLWPGLPDGKIGSATQLAFIRNDGFQKGLATENQS
ncbi:hypothetical protein [Echinicola sp. 20G]|uniref:hypothetical protein n=1 Tax=Echinicola sp. 20G TaxID=2781961 RepID=UPI00190FC79F|nr:hypothetical protein [Echinicola sp. 20G]